MDTANLEEVLAAILPGLWAWEDEIVSGVWTDERGRTIIALCRREGEFFLVESIRVFGYWRHAITRLHAASEAEAAELWVRKIAVLPDWIYGMSEFAKFCRARRQARHPQLVPGFEFPGVLFREYARRAGV